MNCISDFFTYETTKSVVVKSWTIGIINRAVQLLIISYFVGKSSAVGEWPVGTQFKGSPRLALPSTKSGPSPGLELVLKHSMFLCTCDAVIFTRSHQTEHRSRLAQKLPLHTPGLASLAPGGRSMEGFEEEVHGARIAARIKRCDLVGQPREGFLHYVTSQPRSEGCTERPGLTWCFSYRLFLGPGGNPVSSVE
uniref:Purinergic receptor P2X 3 n=1 Tax=Rousettus aegyptiacus TaxID=9407 RepID=A0A7J8H3P2_ROUAE|nr:purinergic receptor P2X 3 [Rousettus aegyptiacus]